MSQSAIETWHRHLEVCKQCEEHPFDLCVIGAIWIKKAAEEALQILKHPQAKCGGSR